MRLLDVIAMEDFGTEEEVIEVDNTDPTEELEEVADIQEEVVAEDTAIEQDVDTLDEVTAAGDELEGIETSMTEALEDPDYEGMDQVGIEMLTARLSKFATKYGVKPSDKFGDVSTEDFAPKSVSRREATQIALEAVEETKKGFWAKIAAGLKYVWDAIANFFKSWFTKVGRLERALKKIGAKVDKSPEPKNDLTGLEGLNGSEFKVFKTFADSSSAKKVNFGDYKKVLKSTKEAFTDIATTSANINIALEAINKAAEELTSGRQVGNLNALEKAFGAGAKGLTFKLEGLPGGITIRGENKIAQQGGRAVDKDGNRYVRSAHNIKVEAIPRAITTEQSKCKLDLLTRADMKTAIADMVKLLGDVKQQEKHFKFIEKETNGFIKNLTKSSDLLGEVKEDMKDMRADLTQIVQVYRKMNSIVNNSILDMVGGVVTWVKISLKLSSSEPSIKEAEEETKKKETKE